MRQKRLKFKKITEEAEIKSYPAGDSNAGAGDHNRISVRADGPAAEAGGLRIKAIEERLMNRPAGVIGKRREFAVLIPLVQVDGELSILYEVRSAHINQPGDICFPGGKMEDGETVLMTALRETEEEIGLKAEDIRILGQFDSMLEVNRIRMHTMVGEVDPKALKKLNLCDYEVAEVFTIPVRFLIENKPDYYRGEIIQDDTGFPYEKHGIDPDYKWRKAYQDMYFWHYEGKVLWGLTAGITKWFLDELADR